MSPVMLALAGSLVLAAVFLVRYPRHVIDERRPGFRGFVSFAAGMSVAYVFIDLLPELAEAAGEMPEYAVMAAALIGFVLFYGLERLVRWAGREPVAAHESAAGAAVNAEASTEANAEASAGLAGRGAHVLAEEQSEQQSELQERTVYAIKVSGLAAYAGLVVYLMTTAFREPSEEALALYLVAMIFHFIAMRHSLRYEHPRAYDAHGRFIMAGACVAGWAIGWFLEVPATVESLLLGFLGGMLIMNTTVMELPTEKEGRFSMFTLGSVVYAGLLLVA
jgi:ZIP Zinc transporter